MLSFLFLLSCVYDLVESNPILFFFPHQLVATVIINLFTFSENS